MREHPMLFSGAMVKALLAGTKTQTRRVVTPQPEHMGDVGGERAWYWKGGAPLVRIGHDCGYIHTNESAARRIIEKAARWRAGDRLWVRETFIVGWPMGAGEWTCIPYSGRRDNERRAFYRADGGDPPDGPQRPWKPGIHMPRWACRLVLEITDVYVEQVQAISEHHAQAEGVDAIKAKVPTHRDAYRYLWDGLNESRGHGWTTNPWVYALTFKRLG